MEGAADLERNDPLRARRPGAVHRTLHGRHRARDDGLHRCVVVRRLNGLVFRAGGPADFVDLPWRQADHGRHGSLPPLPGLVHQRTAQADQAQRLLEIENAGRNQRRIFTQAVAGDEIWFDPMRSQQGSDRHTVYQDGQLRVVRLLKGFRGAVEGDTGDIGAGDLLGLLVERSDLRIPVVQVPAHADVLRGLARKQESDPGLGHGYRRRT